VWAAVVVPMYPVIIMLRRLTRLIMKRAMIIGTTYARPLKLSAALRSNPACSRTWVP
jgi:hypothetical protein